MKGNFENIKNGLQISVDWLSFTVTAIKSIDELLLMLGYSRNDFAKLPKGMRGYKDVIKLNDYNIRIAYNGNEDMGIHVDISGSAISEVIRAFSSTLLFDTPFGQAYDIDFESTFLIELLKCIREVGHITRLDVAIDDLGAKYFTVQNVVDFYMGNQIVSKFRKFKNLHELKSPDQVTGHTVYFGSRQSEIMLRIYDKQLEQSKKNNVIAFPWVRWELELKDGLANNFVNKLISGCRLADITVGVLANYVRIIEHTDSNKSRCEVNEIWQNFIDGISPLRLFVQPVEKNLDDKKLWVKNQVIPTLAAIILADGGSLEFISDNMESGVMRIKKPLWEMVYKKNPNLILSEFIA